MHPNEATIQRLYTAFAALDAHAMTACYAPAACFDDPGFRLNGRRQIAGMWHMLCDAARSNAREDWQLNFKEVQANALSGQAQWEVQYQFSRTHRRVHNRVTSRFSFTPHGLIESQVDEFDLWRWSRQAIGLGGYVLGWTPFFRQQMRRQTHAALAQYMAKHDIPDPDEFEATYKMDL